MESTLHVKYAIICWCGIQEFYEYIRMKLYYSIYSKRINDKLIGYCELGFKEGIINTTGIKQLSNNSGKRINIRICSLY